MLLLIPAPWITGAGFETSDFSLLWINSFVASSWQHENLNFCHSCGVPGLNPHLWIQGTEVNKWSLLFLFLFLFLRKFLWVSMVGSGFQVLELPSIAFPVNKLESKWNSRDMNYMQGEDFSRLPRQAQQMKFKNTSTGN